MIRKTYRIRRITVGLALAASAAAWAVQPALAFDGRSPDTRDAAEQTVGSAVDLRSPDARGAAEQANVSSRLTVDLRSPDAREAADGGTPSSGSSLVDARSPDARDAASESEPASLIDLRSPDARDGGVPVAREVRVAAPELVSSDRFSWGDFGLGVGVALGSMLLLAALAAAAIASRQRRDERTGPATT